MSELYIVVSYSADRPAYTACSIVRQDDLYIATHSRAFGPAPKPECERWVAERCRPREERKSRP